MAKHWLLDQDKLDYLRSFDGQAEVPAPQFIIPKVDQALFEWFKERSDSLPEDWRKALFHEPSEEELFPYVNKPLLKKLQKRLDSKNAIDGLYFQARGAWAFHQLDYEDEGDKGVIGDVWIPTTGEETIGSEWKKRAIRGALPDGIWLVFPSEEREFGFNLPEEERKEGAKTKTEFTVLEWGRSESYTLLTTADMIQVQVKPLKDFEKILPDSYEKLSKRAKYYSRKEWVESMPSARSFPTFAQTMAMVYSLIHRRDNQVKPGEKEWIQLEELLLKGRRE